MMKPAIELGSEPGLEVLEAFAHVGHRPLVFARQRSAHEPRQEKCANGFDAPFHLGPLRKLVASDVVHRTWAGLVALRDVDRELIEVRGLAIGSAGHRSRTLIGVHACDGPDSW